MHKKRMDCYWQIINHVEIYIALIKKEEFFQAVAESELLYGYTTCTLPKRLEKKINWMLHAVLNISW